MVLVPVDHFPNYSIKDKRPFPEIEWILRYLIFASIVDFDFGMFWHNTRMPGISHNNSQQM